jgi:hypothetical protein
MTLAERYNAAKAARLAAPIPNQRLAVTIVVAVYAAASIAAAEGWLGTSLGKLGFALGIHLFLAAAVWRPWVIALPLLLLLIGIPFKEPDPDGANNYTYLIALYMPLEIGFMAAAWVTGRSIELFSLSVRWLPVVVLLAGLAAIGIAAAAQDPGDTYLTTGRDVWAAIGGLLLGAGSFPFVDHLRARELRQA